MALLAVIIFLGGAIVGGAATLTLVISRAQDAIENPQQVSERAARRLKWRLGLTDDQASRVKAIFTEHHRALYKIRRDVLPQVQAEFELLRSEVAAELDDQQKAEWKRVYDKLEQRWLRSVPPRENPDAAIGP